MTSSDRDIRLDLLEAALACEADIDPAASRFLVIERGTPAITDAEFDELNTLGFGAPMERIRLAIADRRQRLDELTSARALGNP